MSNEDIYSNMTQHNETTSALMTTDSNNVLTTVWNCFFGMMALITIFFCCSKPAPRSYLDSRTRRLRLLRLARQMREAEPKSRIQTDLVYRDQIILESLIIQKVICSNDVHGNVILGNISDDEEVDVTHEVNDVSKANTNDVSFESDESCCCAICLEPYQVGDVVAWSRNSHTKSTNKEALENHDSEGDESDRNNSNNVDGGDSHQSTSPLCLHAFHHDCILQWLQDIRHDDCPSCRAVILHAPAEQETEENDSKDETKSQDDLTVLLPNGSFDTDDGSVMIEDTDIATRRSMFMIAQGLITKVMMNRCSDNRNIIDAKMENLTRHRERHFSDKDYILMETGSTDEDENDESGDDVAGISLIGESMEAYPFQRSFSFGSYCNIVSSYLVAPPKKLDLPSEETAPIKKPGACTCANASSISRQQSCREHRSSPQNRQSFDKIPFRRIASAGPCTPVTSLSASHRLGETGSNDVVMHLNQAMKELRTNSSISNTQDDDDCSSVDDEEDIILDA